ncbi:glycosyltransferase family 2 protein, partial [Rhodococcus hoagii]|nr:glycosyltransferase family 2 protein [Prescottella equi]NKZ87645.1 glycosyltransferase family 2 protein [Prescottella equi]
MVDNASRDSSAAMGEDEPPDVEVIRLERNRGAAARTVGARRAAQSSWLLRRRFDVGAGAFAVAEGMFDAYPSVA